MGNWNITIRGVGAHHNKNNPNDANVLAAGMVEMLKAAGHTVVAASFTHGGEDDISDGVAYLRERAKIAAEK
jgi:hypothetical protein